MRVKETEAVLRRMFAEEGVLLGEGADLRRVWQVYKGFAALEVVDADRFSDGDLLLFESLLVGDGTASWSLGRQYQVDEGDDQRVMSMLGLDVTFAASETLASLPHHTHWGCGGPPWPDGYRAAELWCEEVERLPGFAVALARESEPVEVTLGYSLA